MNKISRHTAVYLTSPHRRIHWLADKLVFTDKWMTSEATHSLVTLTNEVKVEGGKGRGRAERERWSGGREREDGGGFYTWRGESKEALQDMFGLTENDRGHSEVLTGST